ncbi:methyl-accepting chemotaxis protein [Sphingomonas sp. NPDC019816]|uniref:methyl-accepting chemotaxis protein n=1 Tax=Sphingomonas sp. NPDC019816 TaxID=3390679 RepID=UPI003D05550A
MQTKPLKSLATMLSLRGMVTVACFVTLGSAVTGVMLEQSAKTRARETGGIVADQVTAEIRTQFERPIGVAGGLKAAIAAARAQGITDRNAHNGILRSTLMTNPELIGTWIGWEPNAFDGRDAAFAGTPGYDKTGRFLPYWHHSGQDAAVEPLTGYEKPGKGDWYLVPLQTGRPLMWGPSLYEVAGKKTLMASVVLPYQERGRTVAVLGVDLGLGDLSKRIGDIHLPFEGNVEVLSEKDLYAYTKDVALLGKPGPHFTQGYSVVDDPVMGKVIQIVRPIRFDGFDRGWVVRVRLPMSAVLADARRAELVLLLSALLMVAGLAFVLRRLSTRLVGDPLANLSTEMEHVASGDLNDPARDEAKAAEIAKMRAAVDVFRQAAREKRIADQNQERVVISLADALQKLAAGDLSARLTTSFSSEYERIRTNFNDAVGRLADAMKKVAHSAGDVSAGSREISVAADDLSRRTEQQAASLEETAAAMDEITVTIRKTAEDASRTNAAVGQARAEAERSGDVVRKAIQAMSGIERSSAEIAEIISVIDGIAFQTNLLALNAGVEAARAGESGKGFAVVASEVRALAQRSAEAAKDVKERVNASSTHVGAGVELVSETGRSLNLIIERVGEIEGLVSGITTATQQQAGGLQQVNIAVSEMDGVTQQNAAMVEETTAEARNLAAEAEVLASEVARFRLDESGPVPALASRHDGRRSETPRPVPMPASPPRTPRAPSRPPMVAGNTALAVSDEDWSEF